MRAVFRARDPGEAYRVRDVLREGGIAAEVSWEMRATGVLPLDLQPFAEVWIADEARAEEARALLAQAEARGPRGPWTCACGAENEGAFDACPTCGADRP